MSNSVEFKTTVGGDGSVVTDDSNPTTGLANGGFRDRLVPAMEQVVAVAEYTVNKSEEAIAASITAVNAPGTSATSTTSVLIGIGTKSFTIQSGKSIVVGMNVVVANTASPSTNSMYGVVTSYSGTALVVDVKQINGSGTFAAWTVSLSGPAAGSGTVINEGKGANIASASSINLDNATGNLVHITGTTTISSIVLASGRERVVVFDGALTLTYNASTLILPGLANIETQVGDSAIIRGDGAAVRVVSYTRASNLSDTDLFATSNNSKALAQLHAVFLSF